MKTIKLKSGILLLSTIIALCLPSCKKDVQDKEVISLVALWKVNSENNQNYYDGKLTSEKIHDVTGKQVYIHFLADGKLQMIGFDTDLYFNYRYNEDTKEINLTPNIVDGEKIFMRVKELTDTKLILIIEVWETADGKSRYINEYTCQQEIDFSK